MAGRRVLGVCCDVGLLVWCLACIGVLGLFSVMLEA